MFFRPSDPVLPRGHLIPAHVSADSRLPTHLPFPKNLAAASASDSPSTSPPSKSFIMGKVHGSLARAGTLRSPSPYSLIPLSLTFLQARSSLRLLRYDDTPIRIHRIPTNTITNSPEQQVEKQEKTKVPKGRALKRLKYTRRFVNVTLTGGKRKVSRLDATEQRSMGTDNADTDEPQPRLVNDWLNNTICGIGRLACGHGSPQQWLLHSVMG